MNLNIDELDEKFSIEGELGFGENEEGMVFISVSNKHAEADISLYGAQILNYRPYKTIDILWMSPDSFFQEGKPIRGGIPVCFPWFGPHKTDATKPQHGFARLMQWNIIETATLPFGETLVKMQLCSTEATKKYWEYDFCAEMIFVIGKTLTATLKIINTSVSQFEYTCALHSYFNISSIEEIKIEGLQNTAYYNQLDNQTYKQESDLLEINEATTRHYLNTATDCVLHDPVFRRRIVASKKGSKVTTVWNPGEETCAKIDDIPDDGFHSFVCIEATNAFDYPIKLNPGESFETTAIIGLQE